MLADKRLSGYQSRKYRQHRDASPASANGDHRLRPAQRELRNADGLDVFGLRDVLPVTRVAARGPIACQAGGLPRLLRDIQSGRSDESEELHDVVRLGELHLSVDEDGLEGFLGGLLRVEAEIVE